MPVWRKTIPSGNTAMYHSKLLFFFLLYQVLDRFRDGKEKILITTNVMSRGIDVEQVTIVVNYDLPVDLNGRADCETYLHRIGRTGRWERGGGAKIVQGPKKKKPPEQAMFKGLRQRGGPIKLSRVPDKIFFCKSHSKPVLPSPHAGGMCVRVCVCVLT